MGLQEDGRPKRLLLVEDEALIAMAESHTLRNAGYEVEVAPSGESAIGSVGRGPLPDLILMDIDLGCGMDGTEAASLILAEHRLPIVFLTSQSSAGMVRRVRGITRYGYVLKNSGAFVLLSSIEMAFELFAKEQALEERNVLLQRAEEVADIGYWYLLPNSREIRFSPGAQAILGFDEDTCSFERMKDHVVDEASAAWEEAFLALVDRGEPYDLTFRVRRADTGEATPMKFSGRICGGMAVGVIQDVGKIEDLLGALRRSEERQAVTLRSIGDGVIATDTGGRVVELNRMAEELTGWASAEAAGRPVGEVFPIVNALTRKTVENPIQKVLGTGYVVGLANHTVLIARDGTERHIADSAAPIRDDGGNMLGVVLVFRDVTRDYLAQEQLRRDAILFKTLFTDSQAPMLLIDPEDGTIHDANRASELFYGWKAEEMRRMNISQINTMSTEAVSAEMRKARAEDKTEFRFVHRLADGRERQVYVVSGPVRVDGRTFLFSIIRDASEIYSMEEEMRALLARSDVVLSDARHRIKNNVQMLASLVSLQMDGEGQKAGALAELQNRVSGMALAYEQLYLDDGQEAIKSKEYLSSLLRSMEVGYFPRGVKLRNEVEDMVLPAKFAVSLGLIVGELVMNACKYAFPGGRTGEIGVSLSRVPGAGLELRVRDDGIGVAFAHDGASGETRKGNGIGIATSLASQERGTLRFEAAGRGTSVLCSFPAGGGTVGAPPRQGSADR